MNVQEYISSGILEAYALGEVTAAERASVEQAISAYPEVREELKRVEETLEKMVFASAVAPPAHIKEKVLSRVSDSSHSVKK